LKSKYCTGGAGWFGNSNLLRVIGPFLDELRVKGRRGHSDVEIGRLIHNITGQSCTDPHFEMIELFTGTNYDGVTSKVMLNRKKQITGSLHVTPPLRYYKALTVHPIKSVKQYMRFHHKVRGYLLGVHIPPCAGHSLKYFLSERRDFLKSCTHNPGLQMSMTGAQLPECPPPMEVPPGSTRSSLFKNMYIISVQGNGKNMKWLRNWGKRMNSTVTEVSHHRPLAEINFAHSFIWRFSRTH
jgi:hypothetical protein